MDEEARILASLGTSREELEAGMQRELDIVAMAAARWAVDATVNAARNEQLRKWGDACHRDIDRQQAHELEQAGINAKYRLQSLEGNTGTWADILLEELGEFCQSYFVGNQKQATIELEQAAAVLHAWLEDRYRRV